MRIDVHKFLFVGLKKEIEPFFKRAQEMGFIHFISMAEGGGPIELPPEIQQITQAIKVLRGLPTVEQEEIDRSDRCELAENIAEKILNLKSRQEKIVEEQRVNKLEKARVAFFGNFNFDDIAYIEKQGRSKVQFFCGKQGIAEEYQEMQGLIYVGSDNGLDYFVSVNPEPVGYERLVEMRIDHTYGELVKKEKHLREEAHETERNLKSYTKYNQLLHDALLYKLNKHQLHSAKVRAEEAMDGSLFAIEGWVSENNLQKLDTLVSEENVYCEEVAIEPTDAVPTYLENEGLGKVGEDLVEIYDTPSTSDKDPSYWVLFGFAVFFAFIVGDGGYGIIFLAIAALLFYKFPNLAGKKKRAVKLLTILGASTLIWGVLINSYYGIELDYHNPLRKVSVLHWMAEKRLAYDMADQGKPYQEVVAEYPQVAGITDVSQVMQQAVHVKDGKTRFELLEQYSNSVLFELALFFGVVHLILSFLRNLKRNWSGIGWIILLIGAYLYFPTYLDTTSLMNYVFGIPPKIAGDVGLQLMYGGFALAVLLGIAHHGMKGLHELVVVIQVFADTLSYLRLYALALAGAILSITIKEMAGSMPIVLGVILIVIAHGVNLTLATGLGVLHGLRLNFLEWYHYSFEGGGNKFRALKLLKPE